jgi:hypothetical protein
LDVIEGIPIQRAVSNIQAGSHPELPIEPQEQQHNADHEVETTKTTTLLQGESVPLQHWI